MRVFVASLGLAFCATASVAQEVLWHVEGVAESRTRGYRIDGLGDINDDGYVDLLEMTNWEIAGVGSGQEIWVVSGRDGGRISSVGMIPGFTYEIRSLTALGDMNGDGKPDYAVMAYDQLTLDKILLVRSGVDHRELWRVTYGGGGGSLYGAVIAGGMDLDGDGRLDLVTTDTRASLSGTLFAYDNAGRELYRLVDPDPNLLVGTALAPYGGDADGDGADDFLMGCPDSTRRGAVVLVSGRTGRFLRISYGELPGDVLNETVVSMGDVDGDGAIDFAAGSVFSSTVQLFSGRTGQAIWVYRRSLRGGMGVSLDGGFDLDQDGVNDILAGNPAEDQIGIGTGWVHALSGRDGSFLYDFTSSRPFGQSSCTGWTVALLPPPPAETYPVLVYTEYCWGIASRRLPGRVWAVRGSPPGVRGFGKASASLGAPEATIGMYQELSGSSRARLTLSGAPPSVPAVLVLGTSDQTIFGVPLPVSLGPLGLPGFVLQTSSEFLCPTVTGQGYLRDGYARVTLPGLLVPAAQGRALYAQWLWFDPTNAAHGSTAGQVFHLR